VSTLDRTDEMSPTILPEPGHPVPGAGELPSAMSPSRKTTAGGGNKRCWNCRGKFHFRGFLSVTTSTPTHPRTERKTACDKSLPSCTNCIRRDIECLGYGLKLSWPRQNDKRRSVHGDHVFIPIRSKKLAFVNASNPDVELWKGKRHVVCFPGTEASHARLFPKLTSVAQMPMWKPSPS
jgi:hypothetical protein